MKRFLLFTLAVIVFAACSKDAINEQQNMQTIVDEAPETLTVGFEGDDTRIQLNEAQKTVWTKGDLVSVFYKSDANQKYEYRGETGERTAELHKVSAGSSTTKMGYVVVAYPYNEEYIISPASGNLETMLPAVQHYAVDSYGVGDNLMVSCSEFTQFSLKSVCGWLKLQLTGNGEKVKSITLRGNNGEQVAGLIHVDTKSAEATLYSEEVAPDDNGNANGSLVIDGAMATEVMLYCDEGVTLSSEATAFYIALPPQTFEEGFTVDVICTDGTMMAKSSDKKLSIERNHIQPMAAFEFAATGTTDVPTEPENPVNPNLPSNENNKIYYTTTDGKKMFPYKSDGATFGAILISNIYKDGVGVMTFDDNVTTIGNIAFDSCESLTSVTIPDSVTLIGERAFNGCTSLTSVTIPDSVTLIGERAFNGCTSLTSATIGDSVTVESVVDAFRYCWSLQEFNCKFASEDGRCLIDDGVLYYVAPGGLTEYTIPDSVTTIGYAAFNSCTSLTSVTIGDSVTMIGEYAFGWCYSLTSVNIPDSVATIGYEAFYYCSSLTSVNIGDSVTTIGEGAFALCERLTSVTIGDGVTSIEGGAFNYCTSLTSVYCKATTPPSLGYDVFYNNGSGRKIYVSAGSVKAYRSASRWREYASAIVGYNFENGEIVEVQLNNEIWYTSSDGNVVEPYKTNVFGAKIISNTYNNGNGVIIFDGDVTSIGEDAFYWCNSLTSVNIPDSVTTIGDWAFGECHSLTSVNIPDSVTTIGNNAFQDCSSLTSVNIPDSVSTIGDVAFVRCTSLTEFNGKFAEDNGRILVVDGVLTAFAPAGITEYNIPDSVTSIGDATFYECTSLTSVNIPDSVTTIGDWAFYWCDSLTSVNIPDSVTTIGDAAFANCYSLTSVYCKATTPPAGDSDMFYGNASDRKIYVPAGSVEAYKSAEYWNEYASAIVGYDFENGVVVE